jgi:hypothetical protein
MNMIKKHTAILLAATSIAASALPLNAFAAVGYTDLEQASVYRAALEQLSQQGVISGYGDGTVKPLQSVTRAELAKLLVVGLGLEAGGAAPSSVQAQLQDVTSADWFAAYAARAVALDLLPATEGKFLPNQPVTADELTKAVAKALSRGDVVTVRGWLKGDAALDRSATRGQAAQLIVAAKPMVPSANAEIVSIRALNPVTIEITFSEALTAEDASLAVAQKNFVFDSGLQMPNQPQLKTGAKATYLAPTTPQKPGSTYTLTYKGKQTVTFQANENKIAMNTARQVTNDTFELESFLTDGVVDYTNIEASASGKRDGQDFALDENNSYQGKTYQIIPSMRSKQVTITPEGGESITATYIPFTQSTDRRQAPKFRLPSGMTLKPGVKYTVTSDWSTLKEASFLARNIDPMVIKSVSAVSGTSIEVTMAADPKDELFAGRSLLLTAPDGTQLTATYKFTSRKAATGIYDLQSNAKLAAGVTYQVTPAGGAWAAAEGITVTGK